VTNNHVLLIAPNTYHYPRTIRTELIRQGKLVTYFPEFTEGLINGLLHRTGLKKYFEHARMLWLLRKLRRNPVAYLMIIRGSSITIDAIRKFRIILPDAIFILYQWDSITNYDYSSKIPHFDFCASFDRQDCDSLDITYLPLFYPTKTRRSNSAMDKYDIGFVGSYTKDRLQFVLKVAIACADLKLSFYRFIFVPIVGFSKLPRREQRHLSFRRLTEARYLKQMQRCRCIVDYHHQQQSGLTMRTIEALGLGKKLITTNSMIALEPFYSADYIQIISMDKPVIDADWVKRPSREYARIEHLRLDNWLNRLFEMASEPSITQSKLN
jgi:hypothetical protein